MPLKPTTRRSPAHHAISPITVTHHAPLVLSMGAETDFGDEEDEEGKEEAA